MPFARIEILLEINEKVLILEGAEKLSWTCAAINGAFPFLHARGQWPYHTRRHCLFQTSTLAAAAGRGIVAHRTGAAGQENHVSVCHGRLLTLSCKQAEIIVLNRPVF
jgi:hypothetical protein